MVVVKSLIASMNKNKFNVNNNNSKQKQKQKSNFKNNNNNRKGTKIGTQIKSGMGNMGAAVALSFTKLGFQDLQRIRIAWLMGYTFVGSAADGVANSVYFQNADQTLICGGAAYNAGSGWVPIAGGDTKLGATYISDIEKHFARKVIHRMVVKVESLNPSTSNNMMAIIGFGRGGNLALQSKFNVLATAGLQANSLTNVGSVADTMVIESYASKSYDITHLIGGGSGSKQNEFDINSEETTLIAAGAVIDASIQDLEGLIPACLCVSGTNTTAGLQATSIHQIIVEQEVSLLDFLGGMALGAPLE